jgi:hypothetical protein
MKSEIGRRLLLVLLCLAMAGFGLCSLCGGVIGVSTLSEGKKSSTDIAWLAFGCAAAGALITWACWRGVKALSKPRPE